MAVSFAKSHIGKSLDDGITADDLIVYFSTEREESLTVEFKSYYAKEAKVSYDGVLRTIAAFLNSEGGLLVLGAPPDVAIQDKYRVVKGNLTPIPTTITTKDSLVNRISDNISYMPVGIRIEPILMHSTSFVYLIEVQESPNKPHQYGKQYPVRLDGQSVGAPHYLVEALFKQIKRPELKGFLRVTSYKIYMNPNEPFNRIALRFEVTIFNVSTTINDTDVYLQLLVETGIFIPETDNITCQYDQNGRRATVRNTGSLITESLPTKRTFNYEITTQELNELQKDVFKVILVFGSKNSTTKQGSYSINPRPQVNLSPSEVGRQFSELRDLKRLLVIHKEENISPSEKWQGRGEERMELTLNGV